MINRRIYNGSKEWIERLGRAFNEVRPRSAQFGPVGDREETWRVMVSGWGDAEAAAVFTMLISGLPSFQINERSVIAKASELRNGAKNDPSGKLNAAWLGTVISGEEGGVTEVSPPELQDAPSRAKEEALRSSETDDPATPLGGELSPEADPTQPPPPNAELPPQEAERALNRMLCFVCGRSQLVANPKDWQCERCGKVWQEAANDRLIIEAVKTPDYSKEPLGPSGDESLLIRPRPIEISTHRAERMSLSPKPNRYRVSIDVEPTAWRLVQMLAIAWEVSDEEAVEKLLDERLRHYRDPANIAWLTGAIDN